jgi:hypothetical protein
MFLGPHYSCTTCLPMPFTLSCPCPPVFCLPSLCFDLFRSVRSVLIFFVSLSLILFYAVCLETRKGTGSRDGLELSWHVWVNLGLNNGRPRCFSIFEMLLPQNIYFNISRGKCEIDSACLCYRCVFGQKYLALLVRAAGFCFPQRLENLQILRWHNRPFTNSTLLRISKTR